MSLWSELGGLPRGYFLWEQAATQLLQRAYDPWLVVLSLVLAVLSAYVSLNQVVLMRVAQAQQERAQVLRWWSLSAVALGIGIFTMHFVGMLAFKVSEPVRYDVGMTALSALLAMFFSALGLLQIRDEVLRPARLWGGGVCMGLGIVTMHYVGMGGLIAEMALRFEPGLWLLSVLMAMVGCVAVLWVLHAVTNPQQQAGSRARVQWLAALLVGLLASTIHYIGMAAAQFMQGGRCGVDLLDWHIQALSADEVRVTLLFGVGVLFFLMQMSSSYSHQLQGVQAERFKELRRLNQTLTEKTQLAMDYEARYVHELAKNAKLFGALNVHALVSVTDAKGTILDVSGPFCQISGYSREELVGSPHRIVNSGKDSITDWGQVWGTIQSGQSWAGLVCNRNKQGQLYWVQTVITPFQNSLGQIENYISIRFDMTQQHQMALELERAQQVLQGAIEAVGAAFCVFDAEDKLVFFNQEYRNIYQYTAEKIVLGATFESLIRFGAERGQYPEAQGRVEQWVQERLAQHRLGRSQMLQAQFDGRMLSIREEKTLLGYTVGICMDVTELFQAKQAAQQASKSKSEFLANMSHEIRTPLHAVLGMLTLLQRSDLAAQQSDYADKAVLAARSLLALLNDILDISKINSRRLILEVAPFELLELLRELGVVLSSSNNSIELEVFMEIDPRARQVLQGDRLRLYQVLLNLSSNACKFTDKGCVTVRVQTVSEDTQQLRLHFEVQDTGIGIAPEVQGEIFKAFTQADASVSRQYGGSGLGLKISHDLIQLMGGDLQLESALGLGSRFYFDLDFPKVPSLPGTRTRAPQSAVPLRVLVVDDVPQVRQWIKDTTEDMGWAVQACDSAESALMHLRQAQQGVVPQFDVVLMDMYMPGMDGLQACEQLRQWDPSTPVVLLLSAPLQHASAAHQQRVDQLVNAQLRKPLTASILLDAVANLKGADVLKAPAATSPQARPEVGPLAGLQLLLAEDNPVNQQVALKLLTAEGAQVDLAANGQLAVDMLLVHPRKYDLVLMDMQMPIMDGVTAAQKIREQGLTALPIIAMTANASSQVRRQCLEAGMNDHIAKPLDWDELIDLIIRHVRHAQIGAGSLSSAHVS